MTKIVINDCFGGFGLSARAEDEYRKRTEWPPEKYFYDGDIPRDDPTLIAIVEEMGEAANGGCASLKIVEIPDGVEWEIDEYDGNETVDEKHRSWS